MTPPVLTTERLTLRPLIGADAPALVDAIFGDPDVGWRYGLVAEIENAEAQHQTALEWIADANAHWDKGWGGWAIVPRPGVFPDTTGLIGFCGLFSANISVPDHEMAYGVAKRFWGRGIATEAATEAVRCMFQNIGVDELETVAHPEVNLGSGRVLRKLGFRRVGPVDYLGSGAAGEGYLDHFRLDRTDWLALCASRTDIE